MRDVYIGLLISIGIAFSYNLMFNNWDMLNVPIFIISIIISMIFISKRKKKIPEFFNFWTSAPIFATIILIVLKSGGMFTPRLITYTDFPVQFLGSYYTLYENLPYFSNLYGWVHDDGAGYIYPAETPGLPFLIVSIPNILLNIEIFASVRIMNFVILFLSTCSVFFLGKRVLKSDNLAFLSSILWLSFPHNMFMWGIIKYYLGLMFSLLSLYFYFDKSEKSIYASSIFMGLSMLCQPNTTLFSIIVILFVSVKKRSLKRFLKVFIITILISSVYIAQFFTSSSISQNNLKFWIEETGSLYDVYYTFVFQQFFKAPHIFIIGAMSLLWLNRKSENFLLSFSSIPLFIMMIFLIPFQNYLIKPDRLGFFLYTILIFPVVDSINFYFKKFSEKRKFHKIMLSLVLALFIYQSIFYLYWTYFSWRYPDSEMFRTVNNWNVSYMQNLNFTEGIFSYSSNPDMDDFLAFVSGLDTDNRILLEHAVNPMLLGGFTNMLAPIQTGKLFVGGPNECKCDDYICPCAVNGYAFGEDVRDYTYKEFENRLEMFNVEYMFVWSYGFVELLESNPSIVRSYISPNGLIFGYRYLNSSNSYVKSDFGEFEVNFKSIFITIDVTNGVAGSEAVLKSRFHPNWHAYTINDTDELYFLEDIPLYEEDDYRFIEFEIPKDGNYTIYLQYDMSVQELAARNISIVSIFLALALFLGVNIEKRR